MSLQEVKESLDLFLNAEKSEQVLSKLDAFEEDKELIENIENQFCKKDLQNYNAGDVVKLIDIVSCIILPEYPVENPVYYSSLYDAALKENHLDRFASVLKHLNEVSKIDRGFPQIGFIKNSNYGKPEDQYRNSDNKDWRPYATESGTYLYFLRNLIIKDNKANEKIDIDARLLNFETHFRHLKDKGIDIVKLFYNGYAKVIETLDERCNAKGQDDFMRYATKISTLLENLDKSGMDIYKGNGTADLILKNLNDLDLLVSYTEYMSKEALMYVTGIHLKKEKSSNQNNQKKTKK